jgi:hypothetical protein
MWLVNKMLSRKKNDPVGAKAYIKENDACYCSLSKLACVTDRTAKSTSLTPSISKSYI